MGKIDKYLSTLTEEWKQLQPLKPEDKKRLDKKFRLEFNYNSNHLEGNTLTYGETELLLLFDQTKGSHELREYEEMKAHDVALKKIEIEAADKERPLTETFIRKLNKIILVRPYYSNAQTPDRQSSRKLIQIGKYKELPNHVMLPNDEIFEYASPQETPALMSDLVRWYNESEKSSYSPIELASLLHYKYIRIHPFDDGNGRIARLLVSYVLFRNELPPVIIKTDDKKSYLRALHEADTGNINAFIGYMKEQLHWSLDIAVRAAKGESIDEPDDLDKKLFLLKKEMNADEKIEKTLDAESLQYVVENSIFPLLQKWEEQLKKFDSLFLGRTVELYIPLYKSFTAVNFNLLKPLINESIPMLLRLKSMIISTASEGLRSIRNNASINGGWVEINFHLHAYIINFSGSHNPISKLYHQVLSDDEIKAIASSLGNFLFNNIESFKEQNP